MTTTIEQFKDQCAAIYWVMQAEFTIPSPLEEAVASTRRLMLQLAYLGRFAAEHVLPREVGLDCSLAFLMAAHLSTRMHAHSSVEEWVYWRGRVLSYVKLMYDHSLRL